jgi:hypothetical protein
LVPSPEQAIEEVAPAMTSAQELPPSVDFMRPEPAVEVAAQIVRPSEDMHTSS